MENLKQFLKRELGLNVSDGGATPGFARVDLAIIKSIAGKSKKSSPIQNEDFLIEMGEYSEPIIRAKIREYYKQFGFPIHNDGILKEAYCDISIEMGEKGTAFVTGTTTSGNRMMLTVSHF